MSPRMPEQSRWQCVGRALLGDTGRAPHLCQPTLPGMNLQSTDRQSAGALGPAGSGACGDGGEQGLCRGMLCLQQGMCAPTTPGKLREKGSAWINDLD